MKYNPELLLKYDEVRAKKDEGGFYGELEMKRSEHVKAKLRPYALAYNYVDINFLYDKPYEMDTQYGKRWVYRIRIVDAKPDEHGLSIVEADGSYITSWFAPAVKFTKCGACDKVFWGKHIAKCDCESDNVRNLWECRVADDFKKVLGATGFDKDRWTEFTYRLSVSTNERGYYKYSLDLVKGPKNTTPRKGRNLTKAPAEEELHFPKEIKKKLERQLVPVVAQMAKAGQSVTMEDWVATLLNPDIGIKSEAEAEKLWAFRMELKGWPEKV